MSSTMDNVNSTNEREKLERKIALNKTFLANTKSYLADVKEEYAKTKDVRTGMWIESTEKAINDHEEYERRLISQLNKLDTIPIPGTLSLCHAPTGEGWSAEQVESGVVWYRT